MSSKRILLLAFLLSTLLIVCGALGMATEERYGGTLIVPLPYGGTVGTLEPAQTSRIQDLISIGNIFDRLVHINPETLEVEPAIAKDWEISEDGLTYTFYLNEDVKFHNGRQLIADDVKYTIERIMDPREAAHASSLFENVKGVEEFRSGEEDGIYGVDVIDNHTVEITLDTLNVDFLYGVANRGAGILPEEEVERYGDEFGSNPVGAGPFKFVEWVRGSQIVVEAFDDYYKGRPYLDEVIFRVMPEASARVASFQAEELDYDIVFPAHYERYKQDPEYKELLVEVPELWTRNIHFNLDIEELKDKRVRQAFNYAIDKELIVDRMLSGAAYPAVGWLPTTSLAFNPELEGYEYNPQKAKELMEAAGFTPEDPLELEIIGTDHPAWGVQIVEAIMPNLKEVGFEITPVLVDGATWSQRVTTGNFEAGIHSWGGSVSPLEYLSNYFWSRVTREGGNYVNYNNPEFDEYLEKAMSTIDVDERVELIQEAEKIFVEDPPVWFYNYNKAVGIRQPWVHGIIPAPEEMVYQPLHKVWIDDTSPRK